ncbi:MAG: Ppx/GppA family phosphatase, partial [Fimbriimonadaceae bacterium]|nr:Ppx/GppA family phosphatase [Alphaproteobacteria bacterium]
MEPAPHAARHCERGASGEPVFATPDRTQKPRKNQENSVYAALDLGTNNCRLLVARPAKRGFRVIDAFSRIIRLGEGLSLTGRLDETAMDRTLEALKICRDKMNFRGVLRARAIATQACRAASNGSEFIDRVRQEAGLELEIVSQETEAKLAVSGCATLIDPNAEGALIFDIGGGSSEIAWLELGRKNRCCPLEAQRRIRAWTSLPLGVVTLAERHGGVIVTPDIFEDMVADVTVMLDEFEARHNIRELICNRKAHLLGTSGTVTTIAGVFLRLQRYQRNKVDGCWLTGEQIAEVTKELVNMNYDQRAANPCIGSERADLVLAGCAILEAIRRQWPCQRLRVADRGLREGILSTLMAEDGV